jgi:hypothetical protein
MAVVTLALSTVARGAIIVQYNAAGATTASPPATLTATAASDPNVSAATLSRGAGIDAAGLTNGYSSNNWDPTAASLSAAQTNNEYYEWGFTVNSGYKASISSFDATLRRSALNAPSNFVLQYSFDGFATAGTTAVTFNYFGRSSGTAPGTVTPFQWMTTDTAGQDAGNRISTQDLSGISALQDLVAGTAVTFRLYAYGTGSGGATSNTVALGRNPTVDNGNGQSGAQINGTVVAVPEPASLGLALIGGVLAVRRRPGRLDR